MTKTNPKKFRSPYRDVDLTILKLLCDLHPWSRRDICRHVGMEPSILSNVFAGQRPLPTSFAKDFLEFVGLRMDGTLDPDHGFVLAVRPGLESDVRGVIDRMFPDGAAIVLLSSAQDSGAESTSVDTDVGATQAKVDTDVGSIQAEVGVAFWDGIYICVVQGDATFTAAYSASNDRWKLRDYKSPHVLLSIHPLPTKLDILKAFAGAKFKAELKWDDAIKVCENKGLTPEDVIEFANAGVRYVKGR